MTPREKAKAGEAEQPKARVVVVADSPAVQALQVGRVIYDDGKAYRVEQRVATARIEGDAVSPAAELHLVPVESALAASQEDERDGRDDG